MFLEIVIDFWLWFHLKCWVAKFKSDTTNRLPHNIYNLFNDSSGSFVDQVCQCFNFFHWCFYFTFQQQKRCIFLKVILVIGEVVVAKQNVFGQNTSGEGNRHLKRVAFGLKKGFGAKRLDNFTVKARHARIV